MGNAFSAETIGLLGKRAVDTGAALIRGLSTAFARSHRPTRYLVVFGVLLVTAVVVATAMLSDNFRQRALADSERELKNTALILSEQIDRSLQSLELVQLSIQDKIEALGVASSSDYVRRMSGRNAHVMLKDKISGMPHVARLVLIAADGKLVNTSWSWPFSAVDASDRQYFNALKSNPSLQTYLSEPVRNRADGAWTVILARKLTARDGEFLGLVLGAIDLAYFDKLFSSIVFGGHGAIGLVRNDGVMIARYPHVEALVGKVVINSSKALGDNVRGTTRFTGEVVGKNRILAAHRLAHYPLHISVTEDTDSALSQWHRETRILLSAGGVAALAIAVVIILIVRQFSQRDRLAKQRLAEEKQRLDTAINNMSQGLLLFDSETRIVVRNQRYLDMYGLSPDVVRPGCTLRELLLYRKNIGSFVGDIDEYHSTLTQHNAKGKITEIVKMTSDGRAVRIVNQPLADGGWVATHEDITEQRKIEQERDRDREFLNQIINNVPVMITVKHAKTRQFVLANRAAESVWGVPRSAAIGKTVLDLFPDAQGIMIDESDNKALQSGAPFALDTHPIKTKSGEQRIVTSQRLAINGADGKPEFLICVVEDVTDRKAVEQERDRDREFLNQIIDNVPSTIIVRNADDRRYVLINRAGEAHFGMNRDKIIGKAAPEVWSKDAADVIAKHDEQLLQTSDGYWFFDEHQVDTPGIGSRFVTSKRLVLKDAKGDPQYLLAVIEDVSERRRSNDKIAYLAHYDALTDLPNRVLFRERLVDSLKWIKRRERLALLYLDLDHFKTVNDTLGHPVGDELLKAVAVRLRGCLRETDIVGRLGGDEFAIIQNAISGPADVIELVSRIHEAIRQPYDAGGHQLIADTSIGIALAPDDGVDPDQLLKNADLAMYGAKVDGRGTYRFFEPDMDARVKARRALEFDLREAVMCGGFELHYQPLITLQDNVVSGCEALLRWRHPERGLIPPVEFIPVAEETGLITQLGEWVLRTACTDAATWPNDIKVAVNVSPVQFKSGNLVQIVISALAGSRLPANRLELEITEAVLIRDDEAALAVLHQLRELGVRIAMDDFGTGYSSLSYLQRFPFDKIKIDRCFVETVAKKNGSYSIVQAVMNIAKSRNITTTAEGVETEQQRETLRALGCTEMQGYLFSPPRPVAEVMRFLRPSRRKAISAA